MYEVSIHREPKKKYKQDKEREICMYFTYRVVNVIANQGRFSGKASPGASKSTSKLQVPLHDRDTLCVKST